MNRLSKAVHAWFLIVSVLCAVLSSPAAALTCPSAEEEEVVRLINLERAGSGLAPLAIDVRLVDAARRHSQDMADVGFFDHAGSDGSSFWDRCVDAGYPMRSGGENIAAGYRTPAAAVEGWMNSPGHRAIILTGGYQDIGVGLVLGGSYGLYWTADFGVSSDGGQPPSAACGQENLAPVAVATAPGSALEGAAVVLDGTGSHDPEGGPVGYSWIQTLGPPVALSGEGAATCTFVAPSVDEGASVELGFRLSVEDGEGLQGHDDVTVTVTSGAAPQAPASEDGGGGGGCFLEVLRP